MAKHETRNTFKWITWKVNGIWPVNGIWSANEIWPVCNITKERKYEKTPQKLQPEN